MYHNSSGVSARSIKRMRVLEFSRASEKITRLPRPNGAGCGNPGASSPPAARELPAVVSIISRGTPAMPEIAVRTTSDVYPADAATRIHYLLLSLPDVRARLMRAFDRHVAQVARFNESARQKRLRELEIAWEVLKRGELVDSALVDGDEELVVVFSAFAPSPVGAIDYPLAPNVLAGYALRDLESVISQNLCEAEALNRAAGGSQMAIRTWVVRCAMRGFPEDLVDPWCMDAAAFAKLSAEDLLDRVLFWAGGIADRNSLFPWIPCPDSHVVTPEHLVQVDVWSRRSEPVFVAPMALEPIPTAGPGRDAVLVEWDRIILTALERLLRPEDVVTRGESQRTSRSRRATRSRRDQSNDVRARRDVVRKCIDKFGSSWEDCRKPLAEAGYSVSRSTFYTDQRAIISEPVQPKSKRGDWTWAALHEVDNGEI